MNVRDRPTSAAAIITSLALFAGLSAQTPERRTFEVVSIKPNPDPTPVSGYSLKAGRFQGDNVTVSLLIALAFGGGRPLSFNRIAGGPPWIIADHFNIVATTGSDAPQDEPALSKLRPGYLRGLLEDRFQFTYHWETRQLPIYALVLARKDGRLGPKLQRRTGDCSQAPACDMKFGPGPGAMTLTGFSMQGLAENLLSSVGGAVIVNRTGLDGLFNIELRWVPENLRLNGFSREQFPTLDPDGPSVFDAVQDQLGLKLESTTGPVEVLVIDHVEHPSEN